MKKLIALTIVLIFGVFLFSVNWAAAQDPEEDTAASEEEAKKKAEGDETFELEEITVTATKVSENQQKVDIAMEVLTGETLKEMGRNDIDDILSNVSTAIIARTGDGLRVSIRGVSDDESTFYDTSQSAPAVAINMDGVRSNRKDKGGSLFDVQRVEVLYGPQSTIYSSNSPGGVVNIVTAQPKLGQYQASGTIEYGNYDLLRTEGAVNVPVGDKISMRAAFSTEVRDGYYTNGADDANNKAARFRVLYQPVEDLSITLTAQTTKTGGNGMSSNVVAFDRESDVDNPWESSTSSTFTPGGRDQKSTEYNATIEWATKYGTATLIPSYSEGSVDNVSVSEMFGTSYRTRDNSEKGAELRLASAPDFFFQWLVGYNYYKQEDFNDMTREGSEQFMSRHIFEDATSLFANITYPLVDTFRLVAGFRRSEDKMHTWNHEMKPAAPVPGTTERPMQEIGPETRDNNYSNPDYKIGFEYDLAQQSMLYGNYSTSYRVTGWGGSGDIKPEELDAYTIGSKNRFFDNTLQVNASAYYYDYRNKQARQSESIWIDLNGDGIVQRSETARDNGGDGYGDGRNYGLDLQVTYIITPRDILNFAWSHIESEWTNLTFNYEYEWQNAIDPETGEVIIVPVLDRNYNGKPLTNSPPDTITLSYTHNFTLPNGSAIRAGFNTRYQTEYHLSWKDEMSPWDRQESYHMSDASIVYLHPDKKLSLSLWAKNIEDYAVKRQFREPLTGPNQPAGWLSIGSPRTFGATLSMNF